MADPRQYFSARFFAIVFLCVGQFLQRRNSRVREWTKSRSELHNTTRDPTEPDRSNSFSTRATFRPIVVVVFYRFSSRGMSDSAARNRIRITNNVYVGYSKVITRQTYRTERQHFSFLGRRKRHWFVLLYVKFLGKNVFILFQLSSSGKTLRLHLNTRRVHFNTNGGTKKIKK